MPEKRLELIFKNAAGTKNILSLINPKDALTQADVQTAMNAVVSQNIFSSKGGDLVQVLGARVIAKDTTEIIPMS
jgi:hypothetical protein